MSDVGSFDEIVNVARQMKGFDGVWFVSGGWAIDLFLGRVTRPHEDREIGIARADQTKLPNHFRGLAMFKAVDGKWVPWAGERLELPIHQIMMRPAGAVAPQEQSESIPQDFEFFLNEIEDGIWRCRREMRITRPVHDIYQTSALGIPFLAPEIELLFKAKHTREKDQHDFQMVKDRMTPEQRTWLRDNLELCHPDHPWLTRLS